MKLHFELMKSPYENVSDEAYTARVAVKKFADEQSALGNRLYEVQKVGLRGAILIALISGKNELDIPID